MTPKNGNNVKTGCGSTSNCMPSWQLRQNQSSLDTSNEIPSSTKTKIAEVKGGQLLSPLRHSNEGVTRASPANKITSSSPTVADPPKEKESPTIGGMSGLRRLLMRETSGNSAKKVTAKEEEATSSKGVKKSPSTGTLPSYWSRISSNQPSFLKRFFEKVNPSNPTSNSSLTNSESEDKPDPVMRSLIAPEPESEPILSMTVAQKATHFMKLEHKQRFSKWRNLDTNDNKIEPANRSVVGNDLGLPSPVKGQEFSPLSSPRSQLKLPDKFEHQFSPVEDKDRFKSAPIHRNTPKTKLNSLTANGMSSSEPSKLSLHDRVQMFNRLTSVPSIVRVKPIETEAVPAPRCRERSVESADACDQSRMPTYQYPFQKMRHPTHSRGSGSSSSLNYFNAPPLQQDTTRSYDKLATAYPLFRNHSTNAFPMTNGSTASIGSPYGNVPVSKPIPVIKKRITYVQSHSADNDLSEDGEVSSGGMEVAEIISKSYENSPMVQKKSWVAQKPQTSRGSRDVWRKHHVGLEDNISQWSTATDMPEVNSFQSQGSHFAKVTTGSKHGPKRQPETTTSNLLSLLTAMSSSDDQIDEPEPNPSRRYPPVTAKSRSMCSMVNQHHPVGLGLGRFKLVSGT